MKRALASIVVVSLLLAGCGAVPRPLAAPAVGGKFKSKSLRASGSRFSEHHLLVRGNVSAAPPLPGITISQRFADYQVHRLPAGMAIPDALAAYQRAPGVTSVERLELFPVEQATPAPLPALNPAVPQAPPSQFAVNDPRYGEQWSHVTTRVAEAWKVTTGRPEVVVATLDTGADFEHPDLLGQVINGPDLAEGKPDSRDIDMHGTHVAGIIVAKANNGLGGAGVAPGARVLALKVFEPYFEDGQFQGTYYNAVSLAKAIHYAATQGNAKIINISAGIADDELVSSTLAFARGRGLLVCVSAGNKGSNLYTGQAKYQDGVLSVHATDPMDRLARFSNFGHTLGVSAPGASIFSTIPTYPNPYTGQVPKGDGYASLNGTSMASPFVAGVAALAVSALLEALGRDSGAAGRGPAVTPAMIPAALIEDLMRQATVDLGLPGRDETYGSGRVDALKAVQLAQSPDWVARAGKSLRRLP